MTRARSRLYVVGDRRYWADQDGLLSDLAKGAQDGGAEAAPDEARSRLFQALSQLGGAPEAGRAVSGYSCDVAAAGPRSEVAAIVDRCGLDVPADPGAGAALARAFDEAALFEAVSGIPTVRLPFWRCLCEPRTAAGELLGR